MGLLHNWEKMGGYQPTPHEPQPILKGTLIQNDSPRAKSTADFVWPEENDTISTHYFPVLNTEKLI